LSKCTAIYIWPFSGQIKLKNCNKLLNICLLFAVVWPSRKYKFSFLPAIIKQLERRPELPRKGVKGKEIMVTKKKKEIHFIFTSIAICSCGFCFCSRDRYFKLIVCRCTADVAAVLSLQPHRNPTIQPSNHPATLK